MKHRKLSDRSILGRYAVSVVASSALLTAGCANLTSTVPGVAPLGKGAKITGKVHGGSQPVVGSVVSLYFAGQSGLRSAATLAATTTTDTTGAFAFTKDPVNGTSYPNTASTFSCPTNVGDPQVYVIARGGNTQDTTSNYNNTAVAFLAGFGACSGITSSSFVVLSEVTTVATLAAVQQYIDPISESIGADGIGIAYNGLANAFNLALTLLYDPSTGLARNASTRLGVSVPVTATPEQAKINQIANILAACANNQIANNPPCVSLRNNALPPSLAVTGPSPTAQSQGLSTLPVPNDILQAALYMLTNPTDGSVANLTNIYNIASAVGAPYQPTLTAIPTDWTIGVSYASSGNCTQGGGFIQNANQLSIDASGNLFISNGGGNLSELSPSGVPLACQSLPAGGSAGSVIDPAGNVWVASYAANNLFIYRYTPSSGAILSYPTPFSAIGLTADGLGNIYFSTFSPNAGLYVIANGSSDVSGSQHTATLASSTIGGQAFQLMADSAGAIWASSYAGTLSKTIPTTTAGVTTYVTTTFSMASPSYGISVTNSGNVYAGSSGATSQATYFTGSGASYTQTNGFPTATNAAGLNSPTGISVDGAQNLWVANLNLNSAPGSNPATTSGSVSELSASGVSLSADSTGFQKGPSYLTTGRSIVIDQSGNVWVGQDNSSVVTEIIGAGVPLYQPFSLGLSNGRFQSIP